MAADFTGWETDNDEFEEQFERLVKALSADPGARDVTPESRLWDILSKFPKSYIDFEVKTMRTTLFYPG